MGANVRAQTSQVYEFGDFRLDTHTPRLCLAANNQPVKIQPKQLRLLCILVERHGQEVSSEELYKYVWEGASLSPLGKSDKERLSRGSDLNKLHTQFKLLRQLIGKEMIDNPRRGWYCFKAPVKIITIPPEMPEVIPVVPNLVSEGWHETPEEVVSDFEFKDWLIQSKECRRIKLFLGAGVIFSLLYSIAYLLRHLINLPTLGRINPGVVLCSIQFVVIGGALCASYFIFDENVKVFPASAEADAALMEISGYTDKENWQKAKAGTISSLRQFSDHWKFLLAAWSCLYFLLIFVMYFKVPVEEFKALAVPGIQQVPEYPSRLFWFCVVSIAANIFNNLNSLALALCFVVLNHPTVFREDQQKTSLDRITKRILRWGVLATAVFTLVEVLLVFFPPQRWFNWMTTPNYMWALDLLSGLVGAITLSLCVGRIQSKFLGPSTWLPLSLYLYVAIQSFYAAIPTESWGGLMIEAALVLKCLLYLYVAWLFKSGRLLFYLARVKTIYQKADIEWHGFLANLNRG